MLDVDNLQSHPLPLVFVLRKPNGGETAGTELMYNSIAPIIIPIAQVNRMEAPRLIFLDVFGVTDTLGEEEACIIVLFKGVRRDNILKDVRKLSG